MAVKLIEHCAAVKRFLDGVSDPALADKARHGQLGVLLQLFKTTPMRFQEATEAQRLLQEMRWQPDDLSLLTNALMDALPALTDKVSSGSSSSNSRRSLQDYTALASYFTHAQWVSLANTETPASQNMHMILEHAIKLGLACPSEGTMQHIGSLYVSLCEPNANSPAMKHEVFKALKAQLKRTHARMAVSGPWVQSLPNDPAICQQLFPQWWQLCFGEGEGPVPCQVSQAGLQHEAASIPMRCTRLDAKGGDCLARQNVTRAPQQNIMLQQHQVGGLEMFAQTMMQTMTQMADMQRMTLQFLQANGSAAALRAPEPVIPELVETPRRALSVPALADLKSPMSRAPSMLALELQAKPSGIKRLSVMESTAMVTEAIAPKGEKRAKTSSCPVEEADDPDDKPDGDADDAADDAPVAKRRPKVTTAEAPKKKPSPAKAKGKATGRVQLSKCEKKPTWGNKKSRSQIMCRGKDGTCTGIKYGGSGMPTEAKAIQMAKKWLAEQVKGTQWDV